MTLLSQRRALSSGDEVREKLIAAWARTDEIFAILPPGELVATPIVWRHPFVFYVGHLPAFSWNQIGGAILHRQSCKPEFDELYCRGMDPDVDTGECHWHPAVPEQWPTLAETLSYRDSVRAALLESLEEVARSGGMLARDGAVFQMVLEHEFMHQETLMYVLQQVPAEKKRRPGYSSRYSFQCSAIPRVIPVPAGQARLGAKFGD